MLRVSPRVSYRSGTIIEVAYHTDPGYDYPISVTLLKIDRMSELLIIHYVTVLLELWKILGFVPDEVFKQFLCDFYGRN